LDFQKNAKTLKTLLETNLTKQSLTVQINNYACIQQWLGSSSGSWEL